MGHAVSDLRVGKLTIVLYWSSCRPGGDRDTREVVLDRGLVAGTWQRPGLMQPRPSLMEPERLNQ